MEKSLKAPRHPQGDLFVVDGLDVVAKDDLVSMEHAFYSLTKKPVAKIDPYTYQDKSIEFKPSTSGFPTIYDKDLVIYTISCVIASLDEGEDPPRYVTFDPYDFLVFTERSTGGRAYDALCESVDRLVGSRFRTNIKINGQVKDAWRQIIGDVELTTDAKTRKPRKITIQLSDMLMDMIKNREVLTLNRDYFRLKRPIERRIYQLARKHMGHQKSWSPYLETLHKKSGSRGSLREFRRSLKALVATDHLPDYHTHYDAENDRVDFTPKASFVAAYDKDRAAKSTAENRDLPALKPAIIEKAKAYCPTGVSVYDLEQNWRDYWEKSGRPPLNDHNGAFIGWCKKLATNDRCVSAV